MKVELAKTAGFCFGVKRAVDTVYEQISANQDKKIYTYGPIIHNEEVIKDLQNLGVTVIYNEEDLDRAEPGIMIIRSHGVSRNTQNLLEAKGHRIVDATCPFVKKIHKIVEEKSSEGYHIVIVGNPVHPEVQGIVGWSVTKPDVIQDYKDAEAFHPDHKAAKICIVSQTTFNYRKFQDIVEIIEKKGYYISVLNTICNATKERQEEARRIAGCVDAMIVIGDKHSSNTQKLFEICKNACLNTYYIQTLVDLDTSQLRSVETVGITAGASTPKKIIEEVQRCLS